MKKQKLSTACVLVLLWVVTPGLGLAQGNDGPQGWLRLLAVGNSPPYREKVVKGVRMQIAPPQGSIPPRQLLIPGRKDSVQRVRLQFGVITPAKRTSKGTVPLKELGAGEDDEPWMKLKTGNGEASLAILFRHPKKDWEAPRVLMLPDDLTTHPEGAVRVVNASVYSMRVEVGKATPFVMTPGAVKVLRSAGNGVLTNTPLKIFVQIKGDWKQIYNAALNQAENERTNVVVYRSDGEKPRRPAAALVLRERAEFPRPPRPPRAGDSN